MHRNLVWSYMITYIFLGYIGKAQRIHMCVLLGSMWLNKVKADTGCLQWWVSSAGVSLNYCVKYYSRFYRAHVINLIVELSFMWYGILSKLLIIPTFLFIHRTSIISSIEPMECLLSKRCANFDFPFPCLYSWKSSWNLIWKGLPLCPIYFLLPY